ncbi:MAG: hypothetical protein WBA17_03940 [Saprospiraceae bacterium]
MSRTAPFISLTSRLNGAALLLSGGVAALWIFNWWCGRSLFLDEANLARNLFERSGGQLLRPLSFEQYAPPLWLLATDGLTHLFGFDERVLRLPALLSGLAILVLGWWLPGRWFGAVGGGSDTGVAYSRLLWPALAGSSLFCLQYFTECKPYGTDLLVAAGLMYAALSPRAKGVSSGWVMGWAAAGVLIPWFSLPAVFGLAATGLYLWYGSGRAGRWVWPAVFVIWGISFVLLYLGLLRDAVGISALQNFHREYFFPVDFWRAGAWVQAGGLLIHIFRAAVGHTVWALVWSGLLLLTGAIALLQRRPILLWLALGSLVAAVAVSAAGKYSLIVRLCLFALPGLWMLVIYGTSLAAARRPKFSRPILLVGWIISMAGANIYQHTYRPLETDQVRRILAERAYPDSPVFADGGAAGSVVYYATIHPRTSQGSGYPLFEDVRDGTLADFLELYKESPRLTLIFSLITTQRHYEQVERAVGQLERAGYRIRRVDYYRGVRLEVER